MALEAMRVLMMRFVLYLDLLEGVLSSYPDEPYRERLQ